MVAEGKLSMTKDKILRQGPAPGAFAEGAARFEELARSVKAQQVTEQQGAPFPENGVLMASPDEVWAAKYMSQSIGPSGTHAAATLAPVPHAAAIAPDFSELKRSYAPASEFTPRGSAKPGLSAPMAVRLGREERPRRSWLTRLFRGT